MQAHWARYYACIGTFRAQASGVPLSTVNWTENRRVTSLRARSRSADFVVRVIEGFRRHRSGRNATLIAYFGFLSIFPLFLAFTTILGFLLHTHTSWRDKILNSTLSQLPFVGQQIETDPSKLHGNAIVLALGLLGSLWGGMKAFVAVHKALDDIAEEPLDRRANVFKVRVRALMGIGYIGGAQIGATIIASIVGVTGVALVSKVLLFIGTAAVDAIVLLLSYRWLRTANPRWPTLVPGAVIGGVLFAGLQLVGVAIVGRQIAHASPVYGTFASVIGLMFWLTLHADIALAGAELNAALVTDRPPRPPDCD
jgi:membrane protein